MTISEELEWRGLINQTTYKDIKELDSQDKITFYHGFDASTDSQTIGNLAAMMLDKLLIRHGHNAVLLAGGSTSLIGDPGGKDSERVLQEETDIANNIAKTEEQLKHIFAGSDFKLVNNLDWTKDLKVLDFLRDIGKHFSMTPLVQRDYIAKRIGENGRGISYTEFSYTLLQGLDYLYLFDNYDCTLQLGGSDQWGNCISGVELIRRKRSAEVNVITLPLIINKTTNKKFGKSESGAVWLDRSKTSIYKFYQFWLNVDDEGVESYLKIFTELEKSVIDEIIELFNKNKSSRSAQKTLAYEATKIVHGIDKAKSIKNVTEVLYENNSYESLTVENFKDLEAELPVSENNIGDDIIPVLITGGLVTSNSEARRLINENGLSINGRKLYSGRSTLEHTDNIKGYAVVRKGKNNQMLVKFK